MMLTLLAALALGGSMCAFVSGYLIGWSSGNRAGRNVFQQKTEEVVPDRTPIAVDGKGTAVLVAVEEARRFKPTDVSIYKDRP